MGIVERLRQLGLMYEVCREAADEIVRLREIISENEFEKLKLSAEIFHTKRDVQRFKNERDFYKSHNDRLWNTLMAVQAIVGGYYVPPVPEVTESYYGSIIKDAMKLAQNKRYWWRLW
jgi:hypothetical protein